MASERELVIALLDPDANNETNSTIRHLSKSSEENNAKFEPEMVFILDRIFEGACRPFKIRVEQVLQSQPSLIISYKLSNTLEFYSHTVSCWPFVLWMPWSITNIWSCSSFRFRICLEEIQLSAILFGYSRMLLSKPSSTFLRVVERNFWGTLHWLQWIYPHHQQWEKEFPYCLNSLIRTTAWWFLLLAKSQILILWFLLYLIL